MSEAKTKERTTSEWYFDIEVMLYIVCAKHSIEMSDFRDETLHS